MQDKKQHNMNDKAFLNLLASLPFVYLSIGLIVYKYWQWFIEPVFNKQLLFGESVGIGAVLIFLTFLFKNKTEDDSKALSYYVTKCVAAVFVTLSLGWVVKILI